MEKLAALPLLSLIVGVVLQLLLGKILNRPAKGWLACATGLAALAGTLMLLPAVSSGKSIDATVLTWDVGVPLQYHIDGLSLLFALMATGIGTAILLYCVGYMAHEPHGTTRFYALMLAFMAGLVNLVCSANLLMAYLSWEVIGLCSYFLVGFWYRDQAAADGSRKVLVMTHLAGYGLLAAILLLYARTGAFLWTDPAVAPAFNGALFVLMLIAAMAKSVIYPLHTWIPEAMNAPTPVSALLHSACYVKAGVYLVARLYSLSPWPRAWNTSVLVLGCMTMLVGALFALGQTDLKRLLAFSTVSQLGHIITALGLGTGLGISAGLFYCFSHGLFKGTLFLCSGAVQHATGTRDMRRLGGLATLMPRTARIWLIAAAAIVGVPVANGFVAKWLLYDAALESGQVVVVIVAWLASVFTAFYMLKATVGVFYGDLPADLRGQRIEDPPLTMQVGMGVLAFLCVLFGVAPQILMQWIVAPAVRSLGFAWTLDLSWMGIRTGSAGAQMTAGAAVVVVALAAGWSLYHVAHAPRAETAGVFTGGDPLPVVGDAVAAADFADLAEMVFAPVCAAADPDPLYLGVWHALKGLAEKLNRALLPIEKRPAPAVAILALGLLAAALIW